MSAEEYARIRDLNAAELQRFCDRVADQARARGLDQAALNDLAARLMRSRLRIVVDTNALVSRLLLPSSVPGQAVRKAVDDSILLVSEATMNELADVLARHKFDRDISLEDRQQFLRLLGRVAEFVPITYPVASAAIPKTTNFSKSR